MNIRRGSIHLFRFAGVDLFLHWSWFLAALYIIGNQAHDYSSLSWNALEYLALFLIVMLHEFGHSLACRQVGGTSNQIVLWPLGGVAYVDPPPRPGATLWSIAAGPLVNAALIPILWALLSLSQSAGSTSDAHTLLGEIWKINLGLLIFNMLPIYPLDGGQILRALLWFAVGRARSLMAATVIGFVGIAGLIGLAVWMQSSWFAVISVFLLLNCWGGLKYSLALSRRAKLPRREGFACPFCKEGPLIGPYWLCSLCGKPFDTFQSQAVCPNCSSHFATTKCGDCGRSNPMAQWVVPVFAPPIA